MNFFASPQCIGYQMQFGRLTREMCFPSDKTVINQLKEAVEKYNAKFVYVASDDQHLISVFEANIKNVSRVELIKLI